MKKRQKKTIPLKWGFWIVFILFITALFLLYKNTIVSVLDKTQAATLFFSGKKTINSSSEKSVNLPPFQKKEELRVLDDRNITGKQHLSDQKEVPAVQQELSAAEDVQKTNNPLLSVIEKVPPKKKQEQEKLLSPPQILTDSDVQAKETRQATLFLLSLNADGSIMRRSIQKKLPKSSAPMTDALKALFAYPDSEGSLRTLIPAGTKLRSAWVKGGVAFIDVSEDFQYNQYGVDGYLAQLAQVVFTATEFPTVQAVQFLIEGQSKDYLGLEGIWIGSPLSRSSFR